MTALSQLDLSTVRSRDPLDERLADTTATRPGLVGPSRRTRWLWLGWSPTTVPVAALLLVGMALGPQGVGVVPPSALDFLDLGVTFAAAVIGVLLGLAVGVGHGHRVIVLATAILEGGLTVAAVAIGLPFIAGIFMPTERADSWWQFAMFAGLCAAPSLTVPTGGTADSNASRSRVVEMEGLFAIVGGGLMLAFVREGDLSSTLSLTAQATLAILVLATAGWLLLTSASSDTEQRVFTVAMLLLVGGAAEYLSLSALLTGVVAGVFWQRIGGEARESISRDAAFLQHPLLVMLLIVAGARAEPTVGTLGVALGYIFLRAAGKAGGNLIARYGAGASIARDLGPQLLSPGVVGVAFALNALDAVGPAASTVFTAVVLGTIGSDLLTQLIGRREDLAS